MKTRTKAITTVALLFLIGGIAAADYAVPGNEYLASVFEGISSSISSEASVPDFDAKAAEQNLELEKTSELNLLSQVVLDGTPIESRAILSQNDRAGSMTWVESEKSQDYLTSLKEALLTAFSPGVTDLRDETMQTENGEQSVLSFFDPAISDERIYIVRSGNSLYEFHIVNGQDNALMPFIESVTSGEEEQSE